TAETRAPHHIDRGHPRRAGRQARCRSNARPRPGTADRRWPDPGGRTERQRRGAPSAGGITHMDMKKEHIGVLVVGGLLLFGLGMFLIGDRHQAFARHSEFYAEFVNLAGLSNGAKVRVAGMDAGQVRDITVPTSPSSRFRVKWRIDTKLRGLVRTD